MKKALSLILALVMALSLTVPAFATDNSATINATVGGFSYEVVIPSTTSLTEAAHTDVLLGTDGKVTITKLSHASEDYEVFYTVGLTNGTLTNAAGNTIATTYGYKQGSATNYTAIAADTKVTVFTGGEVVDSYVAVSADDTQWKAAASGNYTASVVFNFEKEESTEGATFKAVAVKDETNSTQQKTYYDLTFYFDKKNHNPSSSADIIVCDNLPTAANDKSDWGYNEIRTNIKSVTIDQSIKNLQLTKTVGMFAGMQDADNITGAEYLDMSKVTSAKQMFSEFGKLNRTLSVVPNVSGWKVQRITDMSEMFSNYGSTSTVLNAVPDVSGWNTASIKNISGMFESYAMASTALTAVPDISKWCVDDLSNMDKLFKYYGKSSSVLNFTLDLSGWVNLGDMTSSGTSTFENVGKTGSTWSVTIPYETLCDDYQQDPPVYNTAEKWCGYTEDIYITPKTGCSFTVAPAVVD